MKRPISIRNGSFSDLLYAVLDTAEIGIFLVDDQSRIVFWNTLMSKASGIPPVKAVGLKIEQVFPELANSRLAVAIDQALRSGMSSVLSQKLHRSLLPLQRVGHNPGSRDRMEQMVIVKRFREPEERPYCLIQVTDVTNAFIREQDLKEQAKTLREMTADLQKSMAALLESEERYALVVRGANDGTWDWDLVNNKIFFSVRWKEMLGLGPESIFDQPDAWFRRIHPSDVGRLQQKIRLHLDAQCALLEDEHRVEHQDGSYRWVFTRGVAIRDEQGRAVRMAGSQTDITERKIYDPLTGLPNVVLLTERLERAIERSRSGHSKTCGVLLFNIDRFRVFNIGLGSDAGDELLVAIGERIKALLGATDTLARLEGDNFVVLLENAGDVRECKRMAQRILDAFREPFTLRDHEVTMSTSMGIDTTGASPAEMRANADTAMHRAKARGGGCWETFDREIQKRMAARIDLERDLRRGIERNEFRLHYQPIVDLRTERIAGFEALIRWQHPERGFVSPADFIPLAEETGLIVPIGSWVLSTACRQLAQWQASYPRTPPITMNVNVTALQLAREEFVERVRKALVDSGAIVDSLKIELTESMLMTSVEKSIETMRELRSIGASLLIDDFGTGYSSLKYLSDFPIDGLKIDRSFVSGDAGPDGKIVSAIVTLAHSLRLYVTAEGVETQSQLDGVRWLRCEFAQGYFFSKPVDADTAGRLLEDVEPQNPDPE